MREYQEQNKVYLWNLKPTIMKKLSTILLIISMFSCSQNAKKVNRDILLENRDTTVLPGSDFFKYANGNWIRNNKIPAEESAWGIGNLVVDEINLKLKTICDNSIAQNAKKGSSVRMIADYWKTAMDTIKTELLGTTPLNDEFKRIDAISNTNDIIKEVARHHQFGVNSLMDIYVYNDLINSDKMSLYLSQGGLGLPNRDYYFNNDERSANIRKEYLNHIAIMLEYVGEPKETCIRSAEDIIALETILAHKSRKLEDLRDPHANYNPYSKTKLKELNTMYNWDIWFSALNINQDTIIIGQPEFFKEIDQLFAKTNLTVWRNYLKWNLVHSLASTLNKSIEKENFRFYGQVLNGIEVQKPRWKRSIRALENAMGDNLGQEYVKLFFGEKEKKRYSDMVENVRSTFSEHIAQLDWMTPETKKKAQEKLKSMGKKVGYPDKWRDFSNMNIDTISYFNNELEARKWWFNYSLNKLGKPVDRTEWNMTPQTYNAYYNPSNNEIVLPAAIFAVPGFKDEMLDEALIYGYAGASTIGHEITHGFDDEGRKFDQFGNLQNWWTKDDESKFKEKADKLVAQFNNFVVLDSMHVNGKATLGENIADLGGVVLGLDAFKKTEQFKQNKTINGMSPVQRYFLGYALGWLGHTRNEYLANQILTDVHSPIFLRVNGPFANIQEFYSAFDIKPTEAMYIADSMRVKIW